MHSTKTQTVLGKAGLVTCAGAAATLAINLCPGHPAISLLLGCGAVWLAMVAGWWRPLTDDERKQLHRQTQLPRH